MFTTQLVTDLLVPPTLAGVAEVEVEEMEVHSQRVQIHDF
jgi:hypothetical protein